MRFDAAEVLVAARRGAMGLAQWPGALPETVEQAYALQGATTALWGRPVAGVKVGRITGDWIARAGADRFVGPIFADTICWVGAEEACVFPVISGGTALLECEVMAVMGADAPASGEVSAAEAGDLVADLYIGIEIAGSPVADIGGLGPYASIACFGNNNGAMIGARLARSLLADLRCSAWIGGEAVGQGDMHSLPGGIWAAVAFAVAQTARLGAPLRRGDVIATGALTGVHAVQAGQEGLADFGAAGQVRFRTEAAPAWDQHSKEIG